MGAGIEVMRDSDTPVGPSPVRNDRGQLRAVLTCHLFDSAGLDTQGARLTCNPTGLRLGSLPMPHPPLTAIVTRNTLLLLLACAGGAVDAVSYMELGRVFTANMTGNTVLLGLALVEADSPAIVRSALALTGFLVGGALGSWVVALGRPGGIWPTTVTIALALEWVFLIVFAVGWQYTSATLPTPTASAALIVLSALAMGVQSAAARHLDVSGIATTYITGTLTSLVARLVSWAGNIGTRFSTAQPSQPARGTGLLAAVWLIYLGGAIVAGAVTVLDRVLAVVFPTTIVLIVIVTAAVRFRAR
jgi:uncharacterized membrane protein YoaK (UPF0700 family)